MVSKNKKNKPLVSIIIRTKNEERWINSCLNSVFSQNYKNFEVIIVDNCSIDTTLKRISQYKTKIIQIKKFSPGKALNLGIKNSSGKFIVCLSGHCIPTNNDWLENISKQLNKGDIAGVYGRQEPLPYSSALDKRDLINLFGLEKKIQNIDPFFHNANSAFSKRIWKKFPFDEKLTNIEDRAWGKEVIKSGLKIIYEPSASVYHWHGVNHSQDPKRTQSVVKVLENLVKIDKKFNNKGIYAFIPIKGRTRKVNDKYLLNYTLDTLKKTKIFDKIFVITDEKFTAELAIKCGAEVPFLRPNFLSDKHIGVIDVIQYAYNQVVNKNKEPKFIAIFEEIYPFRNPKTLSKMARLMNSEDYDTLIATKFEPRGIFINKQKDFQAQLDRFIPSKLKNKKIYISMLGYGTFVKPLLIKTGEIIGEKTGIYPLKNDLGSITLKTNQDIKNFKKILT